MSHAGLFMWGISLIFPMLVFFFFFYVGSSFYTSYAGCIMRGVSLTCPMVAV